jgi:hypothetical protein
MSPEKMTKEKFPSEQAIIGFFMAGGKGTKKEIAEALSIPPNEGPTTRWRDKLDSILRRLHKRGVLKRQQVRKGSRHLYEYSLNTEMAPTVQNSKADQEEEPKRI